MGNPIGSAYSWWKEHGPNPLITAALLGALAYGKGRVLWGPSVETLRALGKPVGRGVFGGGPEGDRLWNQAMDNLKNNSKARYTLPAIFGLVAAGGASWLFANPGQENYGLLDWNAKERTRRGSAYTDPVLSIEKPDWIKPDSMFKESSYLTGNYVNDMDWQTRLRMSAIRPMFSQSQFRDDPYAGHMGSAIVNNAALANHTNNPTLGNIFDSAVNKIQNKLTLRGVTDVGMKSVVSNATAKMFTGALNAVVGLSPNMRQSLVNAGTWAGTISAILN